MEWLIYLLKVSTCMGLFYALYYCFLQRLTFFSLNRFYLLWVLVFSFLIPGLQLEVERQVERQQLVQQEVPMQATGLLVLPEPLRLQTPIAQDAVQVSAPGFAQYNWQEIVNSAYWLIAAIMLMLFVYQMVQLLKQVNKVSNRVGRLKVVYKPTGFTNCSFLNYVFVDQQDLADEEIVAILQHEAVHANRLHSLDRLFVNACKILLWFNPFIYLYAHALEQVHEYEADQEASSFIGNTSYANLLLTIAVRKHNQSLVHSFVKNPLKARIKMLFTNQSKSMKKLMYLIALPVLSILLWSFSVAFVDKPSTEKHSETVTDKGSAAVVEDSVKYRQKVKRTPVEIEERRRLEVWRKSDDYKMKREFASGIRGKKIEVVITGEAESTAGPGNLTKLFVKSGNKTYYLFQHFLPGTLIKAGDKVDILVYAVSFGENAIMGIEPEKIEKDGRLIYEMKRPKIDPDKKPAPFLFEVNKVRFNHGIITKSGRAAAGKRNIEVSANGYRFLLKVNSKQVALSELASFKQGDKVSLRFVHEVKTGALTYTIADWVSISKDMKSHGVKNKQMFYRFYEEVPAGSITGKIN